MKLTFDTGNIGKKEVKKLAISCLLLPVICIELLYILVNVVSVYIDPFLSTSFRIMFTLILSIYVWKMYRNRAGSCSGSILKTIALYGFITALLVFFSSFLGGFISGVIDVILDSVMAESTFGRKLLLIFVYIGIFGFVIYADISKPKSDKEEVEEKIDNAESVEEKILND